MIDARSFLLCFVSFQIRLTRGRPRHAAERFPRVQQHEAEEGLVPRELSASQKSGIRGVGSATARHAGRTREPREGQLWDKYRTTQESAPRGPLRQSRRTAKGSDLPHREYISFFLLLLSFFFYFFHSARFVDFEACGTNLTVRLINF